MNSILKLILLWICFCSFKVFPENQHLSNSLNSPTHNSPVISVGISEQTKGALTIKMQVEKIFLKSNGLTDQKFKPQIKPIKTYFKDHLKVTINEKEQLLHLKSISENKLRVNLIYQIKVTEQLETMEVFSDCMLGMEAHDRMPIRVNIGAISKSYRINSERTTINVKF